MKLRRGVSVICGLVELRDSDEPRRATGSSGLAPEGGKDSR
jgi:hypothetical protein